MLWLLSSLAAAHVGTSQSRFSSSALLSFFLRSRFHPCPRLQTRVACRTSEFSCLVRVVVYRASPSGLSACSPGCNQLSWVQTKKLARIKITLRKMILPEERVYSTFPLFLVFLDEASLNQGKEKIYLYISNALARTLVFPFQFLITLCQSYSVPVSYRYHTGSCKTCCTLSCTCTLRSKA